MQVNARRVGDVLLLRPEGENLDAAAAPLLNAELCLGLEETVVVLDLACVQFVDSAGLGVLTGLSRRHGPGRLRLANVTPRLRALLGRVPARALPPAHDTLMEAVAALCPPPSPAALRGSA